MSKVGVFVDISDLYYKLQRRFGVGKINYALLIESIKQNNSVEFAVAYGCQQNSEATPFIHYLRSLGFITKYKRPYTLKIGDRDIKRCNWSTGLAVDVLTNLPRYDEVYICSSNPDLLPLLKYLKTADIPVTLYGCNIPPILTEKVNAIEITQELLEKNETDTPT